MASDESQFHAHIQED